MAEMMAVRLGDKLARRRLHLQLTQAQIAERLDVNTETISRFERGATLPSLQTLDRLANALNTDLASLVGGITTQPHELANELATELEALNESDRVWLLTVIREMIARMSR
ncbi:helix-turn-helix transcriptional regulator [Chitinibacter fontanus]|uniref:Helix-turn-helix transcriptional regulator n=1 Tax=Chitinibacter fontanus TaxID=1737446 RepID=A0A7D5ZB52_9NEIS|nr:helix-turn-helix transcriptional regulator [Chitinibacter fontanus]QLI80264.1 helix-turn-helix transcriptional regulator [Chitinibacter fontanus]